MHAGYSVPPSQLEDVPMESQNPTSPTTRSQQDRSSNEYYRSLGVQSYWGFFIRYKTAIVAAILSAAVFITFIVLTIYLAFYSVNSSSKVSVEQIVNREYPITMEPALDDFEQTMGDRVSKVEDKLSNDMLAVLYREVYNLLPENEPSRSKRETKQEKVDNCKRKNEDCKILLSSMHEIVRNVNDQVVQLQELLSRIGILNSTKPLPVNTTILEVATCLECKKMEIKDRIILLDEADPQTVDGPFQSYGYPQIAESKGVMNGSDVEDDETGEESGSDSDEEVIIELEDESTSVKSVSKPPNQMFSKKGRIFLPPLKSEETFQDTGINGGVSSTEGSENNIMMMNTTMSPSTSSQNSSVLTVEEGYDEDTVVPPSAEGTSQVPRKNSSIETMKGNQTLQTVISNNNNGRYQSADNNEQRSTPGPGLSSTTENSEQYSSTINFNNNQEQFNNAIFVPSTIKDSYQYSIINDSNNQENLATNDEKIEPVVESNEAEDDEEPSPSREQLPETIFVPSTIRDSYQYSTINDSQNHQPEEPIFNNRTTQTTTITNKFADDNYVPISYPEPFAKTFLANSTRKDFPQYSIMDNSKPLQPGEPISNNRKIQTAVIPNKPEDNNYVPHSYPGPSAKTILANSTRKDFPQYPITDYSKPFQPGEPIFNNRKIQTAVIPNKPEDNNYVPIPYPGPFAKSVLTPPITDDSPRVAATINVKGNQSTDPITGKQKPYPRIMFPNDDNHEPIASLSPSAESMKTSQQLQFTPSVTWTPYPVCFNNPPIPSLSPQQSFKQTAAGAISFPVSANAPSYPFVPQIPHVQPVPASSAQAQSFATSFFPPQPMMQPAMQPAVQYVPAQYQVFPQKVGPTGPGISFPVNQGNQVPTASGATRFCTIQYAPTFQFPVVPGVSEFQRGVPEKVKFDIGDEKRMMVQQQRAQKSSKFRDFSSECRYNEYPCADGSGCISKSEWCDGNVDCLDASDETQCSCRDRVDEERLCDGYFDCPQGEDELGCFGCDRSSFSCDDQPTHNHGRNCVPLTERCDGYMQCPNGKDEMNCFILTHIVQENNMFTVGYANGYLHRNYQGRWYPSCTTSEPGAVEACRAEVGSYMREPPSIQMVNLNEDYEGPYLLEIPSGGLQIVSSCYNKAIIVTCPPIPCGTRVLPRQELYTPLEPFENFLQGRSRVPATPDNYKRDSKRSVDYENILLQPLPLNSMGKTKNVSEGSAEEPDGTIVAAESRVVGGRPSQPRAWPSLVAIYRDGSFHCGGVILNEFWILTAAHCVDDYPEYYFEIEAGILRRFSFSPMAQSRRAQFIHMHEGYDNSLMVNDLALMKLERPLYFNRWVRPACLPEPTTAGPNWRRGPLAKTRCTTVGWGATIEHGPDPDHMREVEVPILPSCKNTVDQNDGEICAGMRQGGRDACQGDSGGPLMCKNPNSPSQWYVAGIVSHGEGCARPEEPGAYTKVSHYIDWIDGIIGNPEDPYSGKPLDNCPGITCDGGFGRCISPRGRCDKMVDCLHAEDEINCQNYESYYDSFRRAQPNKNASAEDENLKKKRKDNSKKPIGARQNEDNSTKSIGSTLDANSDSKTNHSAITNTDSSYEIDEIENSKMATGASKSEDSETEFAGSTFDVNATNSAGSMLDPNVKNSVGSTLNVNTTNSVGSTRDANATKPIGNKLDANVTNYVGSILDANTTNSATSTLQANTTNAVGSVLDANTTNSATSTLQANTTNSVGSTLHTNRTDSVGSMLDPNVTNSVANKLDTNTTNSIRSTLDANATNPIENTLDANTMNSDGVALNVTSSQDDSTIKSTTTDEDTGATTASISPEPGQNVTEKPSGYNAVRTLQKTPFTPATQQHFICRTLLQNIPMTKRCDRKVDCDDGTDEDDCTCKDYLINTYPDAICDGHIDCHDKSDEENCVTCEDDEFYCRRSGQCIPIKERCDRKIDCRLKEDELDCYSLTNGEYLITDISGNSHLNMQGILSGYKDGVWRPICHESKESNGSRFARDVCEYLGFGGLASFNKTLVQNEPLEVKSSSQRSVIRYEYPPLYVDPDDLKMTCSGLYLQCQPMVNTDVDNYQVHDTNEWNNTYLWPWHAAIYADGRYHCSAVLLEPSWLLTSSHCTDNINMNQNHTAALLGLSQSYLHVDGPHQQVVPIDEIKNVKNSDAILLHLKYPANITRHVQPIYLQKRVFPPSEEHTCVAVGVDKDNQTRTMFLKAELQNCPDCYRCYKNMLPEKCEDETSPPWSGTIACLSSGGWYPAAVYHEKNGLCGFMKFQVMTSIDYISSHLIAALAEKPNPSGGPDCEGFLCSLGKCIPKSQICDGVPNCRDAADEEPGYCQKMKDSCNNSIYDDFNCKCVKSELRCGNGQCLPKTAFCDGKSDCSDGTDEPAKCSCAEYLKLTAPERICDGRKHCWDKSDESPELCHCKDTSFKCDKTGECVPQDFVCDGLQDCSNGEDEKLCQTMKRLPEYPSVTGEVIQRTNGVWHTQCFSDSAMSQKEVKDLCAKFGFDDGDIMNDRNLTESQEERPLVPVLDQFYMIRPNLKTWVILRDDKPLVTLQPANETCHRVFVSCV